jgi:secreted Zn-dependent insulinase-like peptidase
MVENEFVCVFLLTEHMLFYASEKYPVEDSYSKYITEVL